MNKKAVTAKKQIFNIIVPLNIPFKYNEPADYEALVSYIDWYVNQCTPIIISIYGRSGHTSLTDAEIYESANVSAMSNNSMAHFSLETKFWSAAGSLIRTIRQKAFLRFVVRYISALISPYRHIMSAPKEEAFSIGTV